MDDNIYKICGLCEQEFNTKKSKGIAERNLINGIIALYKERQLIEHLPCPMCGEDNMADDVQRNALSRIAPIQICDGCGMREAIFAFEARDYRILSWWIVGKILHKEHDYYKENGISL